MPQLNPAIKQGQAALKNYLESIELVGAETHTCVVTDWKNDQLILIVSAFTGKTFSRKIAVFTATDLTELITKML